MWRTQDKLFFIHISFVPDMENTSQIIFDLSFLHHMWITQAKLYNIYVIFAPDMENISQIILDKCQVCTRCGEHKQNYTLYMSIFYQIWRTQAKLYLIHVNFAQYVENTSPIIIGMSFLHHVWRTQENYTLYMSFFYQIWGTQANLYLICHFCTMCGEHKPNYISYMSFLH